MDGIIAQLNQINFSLESIATHTSGHQSFFQTSIFGVMLGALIGIIPWFVNLYRDRVNLKTKVQYIHVPTYSLIQTGISVSIYNVGKKTVHLKDVYLRFKDGSSLVFLSDKNFIGGNSGLPKELKEGQSHSVSILAGEFAFELLKKKTFPAFACYEDELGRVYKTRITKKFWDNVFKALEKESEMIK